MSPWRPRSKKDDDLNEEIRSHLDMAVRDRVERGEPRAQAEAAARREMGNVMAVKEVTREMWGWMWLERLAQDLRYAARLLRRNPGFTIADTLVRERLMASLSGFFGGLAALLTLVGLYGVIAYTVARRTNEIGVRMALGASGSRIVSMIVREAGVLVSIGIVAGLLLALAGGRAAKALLFGLTPNDPLTFGAAVVGLAAVAFVASYAPARKAARIEPNTALRVD